MKEMRFEEAIREGEAAGNIDVRIQGPAERCKNLLRSLNPKLREAVNDHITGTSMGGPNPRGYGYDHSTDRSVMSNQVRRLA